MAIGDHHPRVVHGSRIDIGALEDLEVDDVLTPRHGSPPLLPGPIDGSSPAGSDPSPVDRGLSAPAQDVGEEPAGTPAAPAAAERPEPRRPSFWESAWLRVVAWWDRLLRVFT